MAPNVSKAIQTYQVANTEKAIIYERNNLFTIMKTTTITATTTPNEEPPFPEFLLPIVRFFQLVIKSNL